MGALLIDRVEVRPDDIEALVRVTDERFMRTARFPELAEKAAGLLPGLARHTCENADGKRLLAEIADTETPHLLEHVAFELMAMAGSPRTLHGDTRWDFSADGRGVFRVRVGYDDDLVALGALRAALGVVDWLVGEGPRPPVHVMVEELRATRRRAG